MFAHIWQNTCKFGHCGAKHVSQPPPGCNYSIPQQLTTKTHNTWGGVIVSWHCFYLFLVIWTLRRKTCLISLILFITFEWIKYYYIHGLLQSTNIFGRNVTCSKKVESPPRTIMHMPVSLSIKSNTKLLIS